MTDEELGPYVDCLVVLAIGERSYPKVWTGTLVRMPDGLYRADRDDGVSPTFEAAAVWKIALYSDYAV